MTEDLVLTRLTEPFRALLFSTIFKHTAKRAEDNQTKRPAPDGFTAVLKWPGELNRDYSHPVIAVLPAEYRLGRLKLGGSVDSWPDWKKVKR